MLRLIVALFTALAISVVAASAKNVLLGSTERGVAIYDTIAIGEGAALSLTSGACNIVIGPYDVPSRSVSFYYNINGKVFPGEARSDSEFQKLVKKSAAAEAFKMNFVLRPDLIDSYFSRNHPCSILNRSK